MTDDLDHLGAPDLSGEVAIVTGASAGLGRHFATTLAGWGATVVVTARRADRLDEVVAEIEEAGGRSFAVPADLADADDLTHVVDVAEQRAGLVTILINNAGMPDAKLATKMSVEFVDMLLAINLRAPFLMSCEVARRLIAAPDVRRGRIVNLSSTAAILSATPGATLYATSKAAVSRLTELLSAEWARHSINVNAIAPGAFHSEMMSGMLERVGDIAAGFPRKRIGVPSQLDSTLAYLLSPASEFVTGAIIRVDDAQIPR